MWKSGTFDLSDINEELIKEIVFFEISYPGMGEPGCIIFFTKSGDEYIMDQSGSEWDYISDIVENFPEIYKVYRTDESDSVDEYGFQNVANWIKMPRFCGQLLVRKDYFEGFYEKYKVASEIQKEIPLDIVRNVVGRDAGVSDKRMVYVKTQESWDREQELRELREKERIANRLSIEDVPWVEYNSYLNNKCYIRFWIRRNNDDTYSAYRWCIQEQKEQYEEGMTCLNAPVECYNLFLLKYEDIDEEIIKDFESFYCKYIKKRNIGKFVRSYKTIEKAKEAASIRNEWIGWGNVDKKNVHMIDYEQLRNLMAEDEDIYFL